MILAKLKNLAQTRSQICPRGDESPKVEETSRRWIEMGRGDRRNSMKMKRRRNQRKKKERMKQRASKNGQG